MDIWQPEGQTMAKTMLFAWQHMKTTFLSFSRI